MGEVWWGVGRRPVEQSRIKDHLSPAKAEIGAELGKKEVVTKLSGIDIHIGCSYIVNI